MKLKCDEPLSSFAFNFNLRRYNVGGGEDAGAARGRRRSRRRQGRPLCTYALVKVGLPPSPEVLYAPSQAQSKPSPTRFDKALGGGALTISLRYLPFNPPAVQFVSQGLRDAGAAVEQRGAAGKMAAAAAGAVAGRCRLTLSNPRRKRLELSA